MASYQPYHKMIDLAEFGFPEVPLVGVFRTRHAISALDDHTHKGLMEICYLKSGQMVFTVDGRDHVCRGNQIFITWPDELHSSGRHPQGRGWLYWMQIRLPKRFRSFLGQSAATATPLIDGLRSMPHRHFHGRHELASFYDDILDTLRHRDRPLFETTLANAVTRWLLTVIECSRHPVERKLTAPMQAILKFIDRHLGEPIALDDLAEVASLSTSRMKARFRLELGIAPREYILRRRVHRAIQWLRDDRRSITDIAYELGFSSSQYFATVFKRFTQRRPSDYHDALRADPHRRDV